MLAAPKKENFPYSPSRASEQISRQHPQLATMVTKSKLKMAIAAEKGVDFKKLKQERKRKEALKQKAQRGAEKEEEEEEEAGDSSNDDEEDEDDDADENENGVCINCWSPFTLGPDRSGG